MMETLEVPDATAVAVSAVAASGGAVFAAAAGAAVYAVAVSASVAAGVPYAVVAGDGCNDD